MMDKFNKFALGEEILKAIEKLGYDIPTEVQEEAIPFALQKKDIIVKSETGSGKTAAYGIPICENIELEERKPQALVLVPTRELAVQVKEEIASIGRYKKIRCSAIFGKQPYEQQVRELKQRIHIIVGTPGRTLDHIEKGTLDLSDMKYLVLDEADEMLNMGFIDQVEAVIKTLPKKRVTMLFSATMPVQIDELCKKYMISPSKIEIYSEKLTVEKIQQSYYEVESSEKFSLLNKIIYTQQPESCILFCNTKDAVDTLVQNMKNRDYSCIGLHGGMEQKDRLHVMKSFKEGEFQFLVATDVAARGIHIEDITHVINYDKPFEKESYVHRIGRTARAGREGVAITFVLPHEVRFLSEIEEYINFKIERKAFPTREEVEEGKAIYDNKSKFIPKKKNNKASEINKEITKIYINAGKKKKIRVGDIVGAITSIEGITSDHIGIIDVQDNLSYIDILDKKGAIVIEALKDKTIKGKTVKVQRAAK